MNNDCVFSMVKLTPENVRTSMLAEVKREARLHDAIVDGNQYAELDPRYETLRAHMAMVKYGATVLNEWMLKFLPDYVPVFEGMPAEFTNLKWNGSHWEARYGSNKRPHDAYWVTLRWKDEPVIGITIRYYVDTNISSHMFIKRMLLGYGNEHLAENPISMAFHSRCAWEVKQRYPSVVAIEINPMDKMREMLIRDPFLKLDTKRLPLIVIPMTAANDAFLEHWRTYPGCNICGAMAEQQCNRCKTRYCSNACFGARVGAPWCNNKRCL